MCLSDFYADYLNLEKKMNEFNVNCFYVQREERVWSSENPDEEILAQQTTRFIDIEDKQLARLCFRRNSHLNQQFPGCFLRRRSRNTRNSSFSRKGRFSTLIASAFRTLIVFKRKREIYNVVHLSYMGRNSNIEVSADLSRRSSSREGTNKKDAGNM